MKLTSNEISINLKDQQKEVNRVNEVEKKLKGEAEGMKTALSQMKETGEYENIKKSLESGLREEVKIKKREEITTKLEDVNKKLDDNIKSNQETVSDLNSDLNQVNSIKKAEVASGANEKINEAKKSFSNAIKERNDIGDKLSKTVEDAANIAANADKIEI